MNDLTDDEMQTWLSTRTPHPGDALQDFYRLLDEVRRRRAASADVRAAVIAELSTDPGWRHGEASNQTFRLANAIADRVACAGQQKPPHRELRDAIVARRSAQLNSDPADAARTGAAEPNTTERP